jgi:peptidoglycan-associated lipoprotein
MKIISSKKIICLAFTLITLSSCQNLFKKIPQPDFKIQDEANSQPDVQPYETVNSELEAVALNQQSQQKLQEVEVQDRIFFGYDAFDLNDESKKALDKQVAWLKSDEKIKIIIEGHCDERGTREYNLALGERRANSAKKYLIDNGIAQNRISLISYGKEKLAFFGASEDIFAKNRRAVAVVEKN